MQYRVCVYAICKNEGKFVERWMRSMAEADEIYVLDTGSTDGTPEQLRALGAFVTEERISPWRFDTARNRSLGLVPEDADICVCTDLDESFQPGWREKIEAAWAQGAQQIRYRYVWNFQPDGSEGYVFWIDKIHARRGFSWVNPVHEVLRYAGPGAPQSRFAEGVCLEHRADPTKSRGQYLPLLELAVQEDPQNDRNMHYLGREYMFHGDWDKCIATLLRHLGMPSARWADERSASMRFIARAYAAKGEREPARAWYLRAIAEAPHLREPYLDFARFLSEEGDHEGVAWLSGRALAIAERPKSYICEGDAWGYLPHDLRALACYHLAAQDYAREALAQGERAAALAPWIERLAGNLPFYRMRACGEAPVKTR